MALRGVREMIEIYFKSRSYAKNKNKTKKRLITAVASLPPRMTTTTKILFEAQDQMSHENSYITKIFTADYNVVNLLFND